MGRLVRVLSSLGSVYTWKMRAQIMAEVVGMLAIVGLIAYFILTLDSFAQAVWAIGR